MPTFKKLLALTLLLTLAFPYDALAYKVVVDAGHGGSDPGAIGVNGLQEKAVNLDIAAKLGSELASRGYEVVMSRSDDHYISLADRVAFTNAQNADLFVSIHANSHTRSDIQGSMVLYYDNAYPQSDYPASDTMQVMTPYSKQLAQDVLTSLVGAAGTRNLGLTPSAVYVTRMGTIPSILVETAFLSNWSDASLLADDAVRTRMAIAIERGIEAFTPPVFVDTIGHWAREAIMRLHDLGWVEGANNRYAPDRALTRAEFVTLMDRAFDFDALGCTGAAATVTGAVYGCAAAADAADVPADAATGRAAASTAASGSVSLAVDAAGSGAGADAASDAARGQAAARAATAAKGSTGSGTAAPAKASAGNEAGYRDLPAAHWASAAMLQAGRLGLLEGYPDGTIRPDQPITRAEVAVLFARLLAAAQPGTHAPTASGAFVDVPAGHWAAGAVRALQAQGLISGVTDTLFEPEAPMTRAEMAALLDRYAAATGR
ncbi:N-acetylmuramoyl-L-alanine amidase [Paenibacillus athensensis]|uniref:SLH domain-containing protein n=1 Tax=Paenibacillus athensensis TaxID=1967502 RepID=A0A4Y8PUX5_9BACL|nr:N-acetylmuramoyl-L-alanine amidase [Paenibacillus athensensis]MCD1258202.1 N-acetylmuramoyl-L-alanine amidase [Paenibacillus athensensis]